MRHRPLEGPARGFALALATALLAACAGVRPGGDGAPRGDPGIDLMQVPDAVPRAEPPCLPCQRPYQVGIHQYVPLASAAGYRARGMASWYGRKFHGRPTATGEPYDMFAMSAAHPLLPLPSYAEVTNLHNGRRVVVRINDRGPFLRDRIIDLSYAAAARLDLIGPGSAEVEVRAIVVGEAPSDRPGAYLQTGAFAEPDNARALAARLRAAGLEPVTLHTYGGLHRVRLGPFSAEQAQAVATRLGLMGLASQPVTE